MPDDRRGGRKKSNFMQVDTVPSGAYQDLFSVGSNVKISYDNYLAGLGVTGTIQQAGDPSGTPVLDPQGTDNFVRTITDGPGVGSEINPFNGITLNHTFTQDSGGLPILKNIADPAPEFVSLFEGPGISLSADGNSIRISATGASSPIPATKLVSVNSESDFPTPAGGVITLEAGTVYLIANNITTANRFVFSAESSMVGLSPIVALLTYTGTGDMMAGTNVNAFVDNLYISAPSASQVFNFSGSALFSVRISTTVILTCLKVGTFDNMASFAIRGMTVANADDGITIAGASIPVTSMERFQITTTSASFIGVDLGSSISETIEIENLIINGVVGSVGLSGLPNGGNVLPNSVATLTSCNFSGGVTPETGIDPANSIRWVSLGNDDIPDTRPDSLISMVSNVTETVIPLANTPVKVAGTWVTEFESMFQSDATGRITYVGERDLRVPIDYSATLLAASGGDKQATVYMALNGATIPQTAKQTTINSTKAATVANIWQLTFKNGDYVELFVENNDNTINIVCQDAVGRVN